MTLNAQQIRRNIFWVYLTVSLLMLASILGGLLQAWKDHLHNAQDLLVRNASTVSTQVQTTLIDASKILDIGRIRLEEALRKGRLTTTLAQQILSDTAQEFTLYNTTDLFGLIFCTDAEGKRYAGNTIIPNEHIDLSDRYYFKDLQEHPYKAYIVGDLVHTRSTDEMAFHLAMPLQDAHGHFAGIIAQQLQEDELSSTLQTMMNHGEDRIYTYAANREVSFVFPASEIFNTTARPDAKQLINIIEDQRTAHGTMKISGDRINLPHNTYAGYAWSPLFGIYTVALLPEGSIIRTFLQRNLFTLLYSIVSFLIVTGLFFWLYRQAGTLEFTQFASLHDALTGLSNRRAMDEEFKRLWRESMREHRPISVLFMDIDHFKKFNDTYGHEVGDKVLCAVAGAVRQSLHRPLDLCCRWGGEEFVAVLPNTPLEAAKLIANHIMDRVRSLQLTEGDQRIDGITISIGIASLTVNTDNLHDDLIDMADRAMLKAKAGGRNQIMVHGL